MSRLNRLIIIFILFFIFLSIPEHLAYTASLMVYPNTVNMGIVTSNDYENGYKETIQSNTVIITNTDQAWKLMVKTNDDNMGVNGDYAKPTSDFRWKASVPYATQVSYANIANYDIEVARGPMGSFGIVYLDYKVLLLWSKDKPGTYDLDIVYTVTTQ